MAHAATRELVRQHQARRTGTDDEDIGIHRDYSQGSRSIIAESMPVGTGRATRFF